MAKSEWRVKLMTESVRWVTVSAETEEEAAAKAFACDWDDETEDRCEVADIMEGPHREE